MIASGRVADTSNAPRAIPAASASPGLVDRHEPEHAEPGEEHAQAAEELTHQYEVRHVILHSACADRVSQSPASTRSVTQRRRAVSSRASHSSCSRRVADDSSSASCSRPSRRRSSHVASTSARRVSHHSSAPSVVTTSVPGPAGAGPVSVSCSSSATFALVMIRPEKHVSHRTTPNSRSPQQTPTAIVTHPGPRPSPMDCLAPSPFGEPRARVGSSGRVAGARAES
jgi:hypothetical protein